MNFISIRHKSWEFFPNIHIYIYIFFSFPIAYGNYSQFLLPYWSWRKTLTPGKFWAAAELAQPSCVWWEKRRGNGGQKLWIWIDEGSKHKSSLPRNSNAYPRQVLYTVKIYSDWSKLTYEDTEVEKVLKAKGLHVLCNFLQQITHARGLHSNRPQICSWPVL